MDVVAFIDARNVAHAVDPPASDDRVTDAIVSWAALQAVRADIVFDGSSAVAAGAWAPGIRVHHAGTETADTVIERLVRSARSRGYEVWLVSSDRGIRDAVSAHVERILPSRVIWSDGPNDLRETTQTYLSDQVIDRLDPATQAGLERLRRGTDGGGGV